MKRLPLLLALLVTFAGCAGPADEPADDGDDGEDGSHGHGAPAPGAPWWAVGRSWDMTVTRGTASEAFHLVNFFNDTESDHFWLGVEDRAQAMHMALWDTNPFLGRIHHNLLAPHESGKHAVMYQFPLEDGKTWEGFLLGRIWDFEANEAEGGRFNIEGRGPQGESVRYDYDPVSEWFTRLEERDRTGKLVWQAVITDTGSGEHGTYTFLRGKDKLQYGGATGTGSGSFTVTRDDGLTSLALHAGYASSGAATITFRDPSGDVAKQWTLGAGGGAINETVEVQPETGTWTLDILAPAGASGKIYATGIVEEKKTI